MWTVNDEDAMQRIVNFGVDGIVTDEPQLKRTLERGVDSVREETTRCERRILQFVSMSYMYMC